MVDSNMDTQSEDHAWRLLEEELAQWSCTGRVASLWWRDDDACAPGPKLARLLDTTSNTGLLLAVIPDRLHSDLAPSLHGMSALRIAQHGFSHTNHAPRGQGLGAWELGLHRDAQQVLAEIDEGRRVLLESFGEYLLPVMVPPWNHIDSELFEPLTRRGYRAVSAFGPRVTDQAVPGLTVINAHCDPIRWKSGPQFRGAGKVVSQLIEHLRARRTATVDADEPTGYLTHHIDMDDAAWQFSDRLATLIHSHPGARWLPPDEVFPVS